MKLLGFVLFFVGLIPACLVSAFLIYVFPGGVIQFVLAMIAEAIKPMSEQLGEFISKGVMVIFGVAAVGGALALDVYCIHRWFETNPWVLGAVAVVIFVLLLKGPNGISRLFRD